MAALDVLEVEGREAVRLKSGRVVWRDGMRDVWGEFIASLRPWTLFGTLTYDRDRYAQWVASSRKRSGYRDGISDVVPLDTAERHFLSYVDGLGQLLGHGVEYVDALEFHKDGWPHHHVLLDTGEVHQGDIAAVGQRWFKRFGWNDLSEPRSQLDVCSYAAKYLSKDVMLGGRVLLSSGLERSTAYQGRAHVFTRAWR